ncbi:uncharacterized protein ACO6RY_03207 [Pungitius sinensis]
MLQSLFLLILMGECSFGLGRLYEYHFVQEKMTWDEAQKYCREKYTDLATVYDMKDAERLCNSVECQSGAWIGLRKKTNANRMWQWSLPGVKFNLSEAKWKDREGRVESQENCAAIRDGGWMDFPCNDKLPKWFVCYNETKPKRFHLIKDKKNWLDAQSYCRENHIDLLSGIKQLNDPEFIKESEALKNETEDDRTLWIGLFRDTWTWSDEKDFSFRHWDQIPEHNDGDQVQKCATVSDGKWSSNCCSKKHPFFCYDDEVILINESKTWEEALDHCREHHRELVSVTDRRQQAWVQETARRASTPFVWMGLRYTCTLGFWFWLTDEAVKYKNWTPGTQEEDCDMSGAMETGGGHKWFKKSARMEFNFICLRR